MSGARDEMASGFRSGLRWGTGFAAGFVFAAGCVVYFSAQAAKLWLLAFVS